MSDIVTTSEETDVQWVTVPVPGEKLQAAAIALLEAAGDDVDLVRTVSGGFRAPHAIVKAAGLLDEVAGETVGDPAEDSAAKKAATKKAAADKAAAEAAAGAGA